MPQELRFEWDPRKDVANQRRHGVSFQEASTVFLDEGAMLLDDPGHSHAEDRFVLLGLSATFRLLIVCHCYRTATQIIRIISARKANRLERDGYLRRFRA